MQTLITRLLRFYQRWFSPLMAPHCRFHPSCSSYAIEAIETHGFARGSLLTVSRIFRCNPFFKGGLDPVPENYLWSTSERERRGELR